MLRCVALNRKPGHFFLRHVHVRLEARSYVRRLPPPRVKFYDDGELTASCTVSERSSVLVAPGKGQDVAEARKEAAFLRRAGELKEALRVLEQKGVTLSANVADLMEHFMVLRDQDFNTPMEMVKRFEEVYERSSAQKVTVIKNFMLSIYVKAARQVSSDAVVYKRELVMKALRLLTSMTQRYTMWAERADSRSFSIMYQLLGECRAVDLIAEAESRASVAGIEPDLDTLCERMMCWGACGRSSQAERIYFGDEMARYRQEPIAIRSFVRALLMSYRIEKADALLSINGSAILDVKCCNDYLRACMRRRLLQKAEDMFGKMERSEDTGYPAPNVESFNLYIKTLNRSQRGSLASAAIDRALIVVENMRRRGVAPSTTTYNALLRGLVAQGRMEAAMDLYEAMPEPNDMTFSILMTGADMNLAPRLINEMVEQGVRPRYGFIKALLNLYARSYGPEKAFEFAKSLVETLGTSIQFQHVGGQDAVRMALIHACGSIGDVSKAFAALLVKLSDTDAQIGKLAPLYTATSVMQACFKNGALGKGMELFMSMKAARLELNHEVYESVIYGLVSGSERGDEPDAGFLDMALVVMKEMHDSGAARVNEKATYMYNALIKAAARQGDAALAYQIFAKMTAHTNVRAIYFARQQLPFSRRMKALSGNQYVFPVANAATYNLILTLLSVSDSKNEVFSVYDAMLSDPYNEPNESTYRMLVDIVMDDTDKKALERGQILLKTIDSAPLMSEGLLRYRNSLRVHLLKNSSRVR